MDLLLEASKIANVVDFISTMEKELVTYAKDLPLKTIEVLELIMKSEKNKSELYAIRVIITKNLLQTLSDSKNRKAVSKTISLINYLEVLGF
jgi:hypothetical protein